MAVSRACTSAPRASSRATPSALPIRDATISGVPLVGGVRFGIGAALEQQSDITGVPAFVQREPERGDAEVVDRVHVGAGADQQCRCLKRRPPVHHPMQRRRAVTVSGPPGGAPWPSSVRTASVSPRFIARSMSPKLPDRVGLESRRRPRKGRTRPAHPPAAKPRNERWNSSAGAIGRRTPHDSVVATTVGNALLTYANGRGRSADTRLIRRFCAGKPMLNAASIRYHIRGSVV